jgi:arylsulfatase A-like enzyme
MYKRRDFLKTAAGSLSALSVPGVLSARKNRTKKPNILMIAIDDFKPMINAFGESQIITPNLDKLAAKSTVFLNNHCQLAVCGPTRTSLMTSLMPEQTGVMGFQKMRKNLPDLVALPQHLRSHGYETTGVGKIYDFRCVDKQNDEQSWSIPFAKPKCISPRFRDKEKKVTHVYEGDERALGDKGVALRAVDLLEELADQRKPFFLGVGFYKPHLALIAPKKYWDMYDREKIKLEEFQKFAEDSNPRLYKKPKEMFKYSDCQEYINYRDEGKPIPEDLQRRIIHGYYACVTWIDSLIGDVLNKLEELEQDKNTIICLWGDHGFHLGDHMLWAKHTIMEQATRSPLIIHDPRIHTTGTKTDEPSQFLNIYPTLCELAGIKPPKEVQGTSMVPLLKDPNAKIHKGVITQWGPTYAYRTKRFRYIERIEGGKIAWQNLFDYENDPLETKNVSGNPEFIPVMKELSAEMRRQYPGAKKLANSQPFDG